MCVCVCVSAAGGSLISFHTKVYFQQIQLKKKEGTQLRSHQNVSAFIPLTAIMPLKATLTSELGVT